MATCGIYGLRNKLTDQWYVGMSINIKQRWSKYKQFRCQTQPKLYAALTTHGVDGFDWLVLEECAQSELASREIDWIREKSSVVNGYNVIERGTPITDATREKISKTLTGRMFSPEHRRNMSLAHRGVARTEEAKKNIAAARVGVSTITEAGRQKIREANRRRHR